MRRCLRQVSLNKAVFLLLLQRFWIQTYFCICPQYLCSFRIFVECNPNKHGQGMMFSPISTSFTSTFHIGSVLFRPQTQTRIVHCHRLPINIPHLALFHSRVQEELSRIAFPIIVLPEDDRTDSVREEKLGLPYWTVTLAICVFVDVPKYLDIPTLEFSITMVHLPF